MGWDSVRYWWDGLATRDRFLLAGILASALVLLTPWRKQLATEAAMVPAEGEAYPLKAPGQGSVRQAQAVRDKVLLPGEMAFTYAPQGLPPAYPAVQYNGAAYNASPYQDQEQRIRDSYNRQINDANAYIVSAQQQLARAYSEPNRSPRGGWSSDVQLAQNALVRAQQAPGDLRRKMEEELAAVRLQRDAYTRFNQSVQAQLNPRAAYNGGAGELPVTVDQRVWVQSSTLCPGLSVQPGQDCAVLVPDGAAMEIRTAIPADFAREVHPGMTATLEVSRWMRDAESYPISLAKLGNRELARDEVQAVLPGAPADTAFVLATFRLGQTDDRLFPPPARCKVMMAGPRRSFLERFMR